MTRHAAALILLTFAVRPLGAADAEPTPGQVFQRRILPILKSPDPSSCVQCHLAGVDLKHYILPSADDTFRSLRDQGLIDLEAPDRSRILRLISMGDGDRSAGGTIHQKTRRAEFEAFADWIKRSAAEPRLRALPKLEPGTVAGPKRPPEVVRHARIDRLRVAFENTVWAMRFRCMNCHTEGSADNRRLVAEHGQRVAWFKTAGPEATLNYLMSSKLINREKPERSLLLLKPLNEVEHGGGVKFQRGDQGYRAFRSFLDDFAKTAADKYADAASLPAADDTRRFGTELWLKLADTPPEWGERLVQVDVYARDRDAGRWEPSPIATSDRVVWGKGRLWQNSLTLLAAADSDRARQWRKGAPSLPRGKYLIKVYAVRPDAVGEPEFVGQAEVESAWPTGYSAMTVVDARRVKKE